MKLLMMSLSFLSLMAVGIGDGDNARKLVVGSFSLDSNKPHLTLGQRIKQIVNQTHSRRE